MKNNTYQRPESWGDDKFSSFMIMAEENGYATFQNAKPYYEKLSKIHDIFKKAIDAMHNSSSWFGLLLFVKSHSAFLAASRLGIATQVTEASPFIRVIIENSLYGFFLHKHPEYSEIWLRRQESGEAKRKVKKIFVIGTLIKNLKLSNKHIGDIAEKLYEQSIDYGAHPNERGFTMALKYAQSEHHVRYDVMYLTDNPIAITFCLKFIAQSAVLCLEILQLIIPERFKLTGLDLEIDKISKDL